MVIAASAHNRPLTGVFALLTGGLTMYWRVRVESSASPRWEGVPGWVNVLYGCCLTLVIMGVVTIGGRPHVGAVRLVVGSGLVLLGGALSVAAKRSLRS
jgi:hypothetical protein